jgi:hypothetical protein
MKLRRVFKNADLANPMEQSQDRSIVCDFNAYKLKRVAVAKLPIEDYGIDISMPPADYI